MRKISVSTPKWRYFRDYWKMGKSGFLRNFEIFCLLLLYRKIIFLQIFFANLEVLNFTFKMQKFSSKNINFPSRYATIHITQKSKIFKNWDFGVVDPRPTILEIWDFWVVWIVAYLDGKLIFFDENFCILKVKHRTSKLAKNIYKNITFRYSNNSQKYL